jgi:xanthine dehydrogenase accessory factor
METLGDWGNGFALADVESKKVEAFAAGRRGLVHDFDGVEIAFEVVHPAVHLIACGSGPDVLPLTTLALQLGWEVTIVDHRPLVESHIARFPGANVIHCAEPIRLAELVPMSSRTAGVVMSHHFSRDTDYLNAFLSADPGYIGVLGPRPRTERMIAELAARGAKVRRDIGDKLFAPIGLDVGGEGPHAIALAIVSEITAVMNLRPAGYLRDRSGPLHPPRIPTPPDASPVSSES